MKFFYYSLFLLFLIFSLPTFAINTDDELDSGVHEPLFVDLVRPINSKKGQLEINSLCAKSSKYHCSPELEYVIADGLGLELELPMDHNFQLESLKIAIQKKINFTFNKNYDHAFQLINEKKLHHKKNSTTFYYVSGFNKNDYSFVMLNGFAKSQKKYSILLNSTFYKNFNKDFAYGIEVNYDKTADFSLRILPQAKFHFNKKCELQIGVGIEKKYMAGALRIISII